MHPTFPRLKNWPYGLSNASGLKILAYLWFKKNPSGFKGQNWAYGLSTQDCVCAMKFSALSPKRWGGYSQRLVSIWLIITEPLSTAIAGQSQSPFENQFPYQHP